MDSRSVLSLSRERQITKVTFESEKLDFAAIGPEKGITAASREGHGLLSQFFQMPKSIRGDEQQKRQRTVVTHVGEKAGSHGLSYGPHNR